MSPSTIFFVSRKSSFHKFLSSLLIASFLLPASALAQTAGTSTSEDNTQPATTTTSGDTLLDSILTGITDMFTGDGGTPEDGKPGGGDDGGGPSSLDSGDTVYDYGREPVGSRLSPGPSLDLSGAFRYSYPLTVPPGRKGLEPKLSLEYSNQSSENQSIFGYGWSDNIPYIQRINKAGSDKLYSRYDFVSSLDGELLPMAAGTTTSFSAKTENGDFRTYAFANNQWTVTDKQGTTYKFGTSTGSRQNDTASSTRIYKWMLDEIRDANGNYIEYEYYKDSGQIYPSKITYTGNGSTDGIFEVSFSRESRTDNATTSQPAFNVKTNYRINEIQAKVNGTWVRKYALSYTAGDNGARSLLSSITETGQGEDTATIALPATSFTYQPSQHSIATSTAWTIPEYIAEGNSDRGVRFADVNGDGLSDLVRLHTTSGGNTTKVYLNKGDGTGWTASTTWAIPADVFFAGTADTGTRFAEVNGDGLLDLVQSQYSSTNKVFLNTGSGWTASTTLSLPDFFVGNGSDWGLRVVDLNGDGLSDLVRSQYVSEISIWTGLWLNTGSGWATSTTWNIPEYILDQNTDQGVRFADVNGDGLTDLLRSHLEGGNSTKKVYLNKGDGTGWTYDATWSIPEHFAASADTDVRIDDINGDSLADIVIADGTSGGVRKVYINTGSGWTHVSSWVVPDVFTTNGADQGTRTVDLNGDGWTDFIRNQYVSEASIWTGVWLNAGKKPDLLSQATKGTGATTNISYKTTPLYKNGSTLLNPKLPFVFDTAEAIGINDGFGTIGTTTYSYEGGEYYFGGPLDRQFAGFSKIAKTDPTGATTTTFYHQGNTSSSTIGEYQDHISKAGKPYRVEQADSSNNIYTKTINKWDRYDQGNGRNFVKLAQTLVQNYDGDSDHKDKAEGYTWSDTTGNLTQKIEWGEVTGSDDGTFTDAGTDKFTTDISYASGGSVTGLPSTETTNNQSSDKVKETRHYYDSQSLGNVTKGNETKTEGWKSSSSYASTTKSYDSTYGLVTQEKDGKGNATNYSYDSYNLFVATSTNPLSQTRAFLYDYSSGKVKEMVDENNRKFTTTYDALDRVTEEKQPDITTPSTLVTKATYTYTDTVGSRKVQKSNYLDATNIVDEYTYLDGLDRVIQKRKEAEDSNTFAVSDFTYNTRGLLDKESLPYFSSGSSKTTATTTSALFTTYSYDPLQRITSVARVVGNETRAYDDWKTTITDPRSNQKSLYSDAHGNLIKVEEINGGSTYTTEYTYNYLKNLTKVTDEDDNIREFSYDGLGRRLTAQDLHASADGTYGTWTYAYDDAGNMTQKVDPKSQTVNYTYDALNRVSTEDYTGAGGTEVTYSYDSGTDGKTRLTQAVFTGSATTDYTYNSLGLTKTEAKAITGGDTYTTSYEYDRQGNQTNITYPDNAEVKYIYNNGGLLEKVEEKESGGSFADVVSDFDYAPTGQVSFTANANGTETTNTYDAAELYRLKTKFTKLSSCTGCGGEEAPEGWLPPEFQILAEQVTAPVMEYLQPVAQEEVSSTPSTVIPLQASAYERKKSAYILRKNDTTITVGDARSDDFSPKATLSRWGEVSLEVSFPTSNTKAKKPATLKNDKISWNDDAEEDGREVRFYELPESSELPEGGYEIDVVYSKKPASNIVTMHIKSDGLDFSYQPPLNKEKLTDGAVECTETKCFDAKGNVITERPENVIGSYAVYHKLSGDYSQTRHNNYKTGKAFHIYRPKITDSGGKSTWGELSIEAGTLTIVVPQDFLDSATYPVTVDPTFGYGTAGATLATITDGIIRLSVTHAAPENGTINTLHFYSGYSGSGTNCLVRPVLYKDSDLSLITYGGENSYSTPGPGTEEWKTLDITDASITSGTNYDLGVWVNSTSGGNACRYRYDTDASYSLKSDTYTYHATNAPADPAVIDSTLTSRRMSLYGTYTASGGGGGATTTVDILQKLIYTYDANGNITQITDNSQTGTGKIANFVYDPLNRLTSASTAAASSTSYTHAYAYTSIGNISSSTPAGTYSYAGTNYANPHAATSIGGTGMCQ
jgi:YD repeat-containing protein